MKCSLLCSALLFATSTLVAQSDRKVIVISLDGFPAYALKDPRLPIPTLRRLMKEGAYADTMQPINFTVTWPNHTAMMTGVDERKHGLLFNGMIEGLENNKPPRTEPWHDKEEMVHAPTVYDLAYKAGLTTAQVDWVAIYRAKTIHWAFPEIPDPNGKIEKELVAQGVVTPEQLGKFNESSSAWRDQIRTDAVIDILKKYNPNLLLLHLTDLDNINHNYGPMSLASYSSMEFLDDRVKEIVEAVRSRGDLDKTTIFVVSDHGFRTIKSLIHPNAVLRRKGLVQGAGENRTCDMWVVTEGGSAAVYAVGKDRDKKVGPEMLADLKTAFQGMEGVEHVYGKDEFDAIGIPKNAPNEQSPLLVLTSKPDFVFDANDTVETVTPAVGKSGTHGFINTDPMMGAIFIAYGAGIRKGTHLETIHNVDVAPTIANLLGLKMEAIDGVALTQILR